MLHDRRKEFERQQLQQLQQLQHLQVQLQAQQDRETQKEQQQQQMALQQHAQQQFQQQQMQQVLQPGSLTARGIRFEQPTLSSSIGVRLIWLLCFLYTTSLFFIFEKMARLV